MPPLITTLIHRVHQLPSSDGSGALLRLLVIHQVMKLKTQADVRALIEHHLKDDIPMLFERTISRVAGASGKCVDHSLFA